MDEGSIVNVVSKSTIERLKLKIKSHPTLLKVTWFDITTLPMIERCIVQIKMNDYQDKIYYDVLPIEVAHIVLGQPWLYTFDVTSHERENTYAFRYKDKPSSYDLQNHQKKTNQELLSLSHKP